MMRTVVLASALMAGPVLAGVNSWTGGGPEGGVAWSVRYVSSQPGTAVAISGQAIYRTTDDGASWSAIAGGFTPDRVQLEVARANPNLVYAFGNNQFSRRSDDGGVTFTPIARFGGSGQNYECSLGLSVDGGVAYGGTTAGEVHVSTDHGGTWAKRSSGLPAPAFGQFIAQIVVDPTDAAHAYAVMTGSQGGLYVTSDSGVSWNALPGVCDNGCDRIAIDPADPQRLLVAGTPGGVYLSVDGGMTWSFLQSGTFNVVAFDPAVAGRAFAISTDQPARVYRSTNGGSSWTHVGTVPGRSGVSSLASDPATGRLMLSSIEGVLWSDDAGATWQIRTAGILGADLTQVLPFEDGSNRVLAVGNQGPSGIHQRAATGDSWSRISTDLSQTLYLNTLAYDPSDQNILYGAGQGVFRSVDAGVTWTPMPGIASWVYAIAVDPLNPQTLYSVSNQLDKSVDGGTSWHTIGTGFPTTTVGTLTIDRTDTRNLYIAELYDSDTPIFRSTDGGESWAPASFGLLRTGVYDVQIDPSNGAIAYAATTTGLYRTANSGQSWSRLPAGEFTHDVAIDPVIPTNIVRTEYGNGVGIARSVDSGQTWDVVLRPEPGLVRLVALDPARPSNVIAAVDRFGAAEFEFATDLGIGTTAQSNNIDAASGAVLSVTNGGPYAASGVRLQITVPDGASGATATTQRGSCNRAAIIVTCEIGVLRSGENISVTLSNLAGAREGEQISARVDVHERDVAEANNALALTVTTASTNPPASPPSGGGPSAPSNPGASGGSSNASGSNGGGGGSMGFALLAALFALRATKRRIGMDMKNLAR